MEKIKSVPCAIYLGTQDNMVTVDMLTEVRGLFKGALEEIISDMMYRID